MKRIAFAILALALFAGMAKAVPATPYPVQYQQPDGSVVTVFIHGDEFYHYATSNGKVVAIGKDGFLHPASKPVLDRNSVKRQRARRAVPGRKSEPLSIGDKHFLVLLIEFSDLEFSVPDAKDAFTRMLNEAGYSDNGGTGSAADYYRDNSRGVFRPVFDVFGPVKVSKSFSYYGENDAKTDYDKHPDELLLEACALLDEQVDFSIYDHDTDGYIDNIFYYYAGHNEAEGASADHIWPHASGAYDDNLVLDGTRTGSYACTSEYRGSNGKRMAGIGTFCHEFAHVLGLPDLYDTDYEDNGSAEDAYAFSLMASGAYNNNGCTPPYFCSLERWLLEWMDDLKLTTTPGSYQILPVQENDCFSTPTSVDGEFFLYEARNGKGWDAYIRTKSTSLPPEGMVIYHADLSDNLVGGRKASRLWDTNELNCYSEHPCFYIVRPKSSYSDYNDMLWPGTSGYRSFEGVEWSGGRTGFTISNITWNGSAAEFILEIPTERNLRGKVSDSAGRPLEGVWVKAGTQTFRTGADGEYSFSFPADVEEFLDVDFSKEMYFPIQKKVRIVSVETVLDVTMFNISEKEPIKLSKHGDPAYKAIGFQVDGTAWSSTIGVRYTAEELLSYTGGILDRINFFIHGNSPEKLDVFVDFGNQRVFTKTIDSFKSDAFNTVDISSANLTIPEDKDMVFGVSVKNITEQYWMSIDDQDAVAGGGVAWAAYTDKAPSGWQEVGYNFLIDCDIHAGGSVFESMAFHTLANPRKGGAYPVGTKLGLTLNGLGEPPQKVSWFFDGSPVAEESITLSAAGSHTLKAVLKYSDGSTEEIEQAIQVQ